MPLALHVLRENGQADDMGHLCLALVYCRMTRLLYLWRGWPNRNAEILGVQRQQILLELRKDWDPYDKYKGSTDPAIQALIYRSCFKEVAVIQLVRICQAHGRLWTAELRSWIHKSCEHKVTSLINEDGFRRQRHKCSMASTQKGRPQRAFGCFREEHVADDVHHYAEV